MTAFTPSPTLRYLAPMLLAAAASMAAANWYFEPARASRWATVLGVMAAMALVAWLVSRGMQKVAEVQGWTASLCNGVDSIRGAIVFAALMMMADIGENLATGLGFGAVADFDELSKRLTQVLTGLFFVWMGNNMPKALTPLSAAQCSGDAIKSQAFQRFMGWTWVITGLGYSISWLILPMGSAKPVAMTCLFVGMGVTITGTIRLIRGTFRRGATS
jgi:hypothetical protein